MKVKLLLVLVAIVVIGLLMSGEIIMPVKGADHNSYNKKSFWYYPWGRSVTHKGVDIFASRGTPVVSSSPGLVLFAGDIQMGGKVVMVIGPKWRLHYYAHLDEINTSIFSWASENETIGSVGDSGNAKGKQPHLHYSILTLVPYLWNVDGSRQGWKKMFYINPIPLLEHR